MSHAAGSDRDPLGAEQALVLELVPGDQPAGRGDHAPPRDRFVYAGEHGADRPGCAGPADLGCDVAVGDDLTARESGDGSAHVAPETGGAVLGRRGCGAPVPVLHGHSIRTGRTRFPVRGEMRDGLDLRTPPRGSRRETRQMIAAFSITPIGTGESVSELVADCVGIVRESGLPNETNAMFTNIEGEWDEVMHVIKQCVDHVADAAPRVGVVIKIDQRRGVSGALRSKVEAVERHLSST